MVFAFPAFGSLLLYAGYGIAVNTLMKCIHVTQNVLGINAYKTTDHDILLHWFDNVVHWDGERFLIYGRPGESIAIDFRKRRVYPVKTTFFPDTVLTKARALGDCPLYWEIQWNGYTKITTYDVLSLLLQNNFVHTRRQ